MAAAPEHLSFDVLRPIVIVSATISTLSGLLLSGLCARAWHLSAEQSPAANVQLVLMWLGGADAVFAASFLIAQLPTGAFGAESGGVACYISSCLNEFGGMVSALCTATLAYALHAALAGGLRPPLLRTRIRALLAVAWLLPACLELALTFAVYLPQKIIGPEVTVPWCHWHRDLVALGQGLYVFIEGSLLYTAVQYVRIHCHMQATVQQAALLEHHAAWQPIWRDHTSAEHRLRSTAWKLDRRMATYLCAYVIAQGPSVVHRAWQVFGPAPDASRCCSA